jgi:hypothetical protein
MPLLPKISLFINIFVLSPICIGMLLNANWISRSYGLQTEARGILFSVYFSIWLTSIIILKTNNLSHAYALLLVQIIYKFTTPFTVGTLLNPVVVSNLGIAIFHCFSLFKISKHNASSSS